MGRRRSPSPPRRSGGRRDRQWRWHVHRDLRSRVADDVRHRDDHGNDQLGRHHGQRSGPTHAGPHRVVHDRHHRDAPDRGQRVPRHRPRVRRVRQRQERLHERREPQLSLANSPNGSMPAFRVILDDRRGHRQRHREEARRRRQPDGHRHRPAEREPRPRITATSSTFGRRKPGPIASFTNRHEHRRRPRPRAARSPSPSARSTRSATSTTTRAARASASSTLANSPNGSMPVFVSISWTTGAATATSPRRSAKTSPTRRSPSPTRTMASPVTTSPPPRARSR